MNYSKHVSRKRTPQSEKIFGSSQVPNSAGGFAWEVDDWTKLDRFLVLGTEGGSYYATEKTMTIDNAEAVKRCIETDGVRTVKRILEISEAGRAAKNDAAIFALAMAAGLGNDETKKLAFDVMPQVARTGTHLFAFLEQVRHFRGWGRGLRRATANWYNGKDAEKLAYQLVKYRQRNGMSHRDVLRLASPKPVDAAHNALYRWVVDRNHLGEREVKRQTSPDVNPLVTKYDAVDTSLLPAIISAFEALEKAESAEEAVRIISANPSISHEMIPSQFLGEAEVWNALLPNLPMTALIRNLGRLTANGLIVPMSAASRLVVERLNDAERIKKARVHPIAVLAALKTYQNGRGARGSLEWDPVAKVVDALDKAFYLSFGNVTPTGKRMMLSLDVSGSMSYQSHKIAGIPGLTPRIASAALSLITANVEPQYAITAFSDEMVPISISPRQRLDDVVNAISGLDFGRTDCSLPIVYALQNKMEVDTFVVYTDNETWHGDIHPSQALQEYRRQTGIRAKLIVVGMVANKFSIADPNDPGMLDVVGFDTATPELISNFSAN